MTHDARVGIIGAGLAGCEAALVCAAYGIPVVLFEMRPGLMTPAHKTGDFAELVCSNSLKSDVPPGAPAILKAELTLLESPLLKAARESRVPAGTALAVDRKRFSAAVGAMVENHPHITVRRVECASPPRDIPWCIIAAGPLVSGALAGWLERWLGSDALHFYDAIAPIVAADSIDMRIAFRASRYGKGGSDYINCPFTGEEYRLFYEALTEADRVNARSFEHERFFEACLPVEVAAQRGYEALLFGTLRPVGFKDPRTGARPYALCQLRNEDAGGRFLNMVGFQTRMTIPEQQRVLRLVPGLNNAEFVRYGSIHRNTYIDGPKHLQFDLSCKKQGTVSIAGQLCGNEGYTESIATGHLAARFVASKILSRPLPPPPATTACGALLRYITCPQEKQFEPGNCNASIFDPIDFPANQRAGKQARRQALCDRALKDMKIWIETFLQCA